jgi:hypothetical protein
VKTKKKTKEEMMEDVRKRRNEEGRRRRWNRPTFSPIAQCGGGVGDKVRRMDGWDEVEGREDTLEKVVHPSSAAPVATIAHSLHLGG